jgi:cyclophilin family peptidyl-prolyl cis-trans isomerase
MPGLVSMARGGENGTIDSRFFVTLSADAKWADDRYTAFGLLDQADGSMEVRDLCVVFKTKIYIQLLKSAPHQRERYSLPTRAFCIVFAKVLRNLTNLKLTRQNSPARGVIITDCGAL